MDSVSTNVINTVTTNVTNNIPTNVINTLSTNVPINSDGKNLRYKMECYILHFISDHIAIYNRYFSYHYAKHRLKKKYWPTNNTKNGVK